MDDRPERAEKEIFRHKIVREEIVAERLNQSFSTLSSISNPTVDIIQWSIETRKSGTPRS